MFVTCHTDTGGISEENGELGRKLRISNKRLHSSPDSHRGGHSYGQGIRVALVVAVMMVMMVVGRCGRCHRRRRPVLTGAAARRYGRERVVTGSFRAPQHGQFPLTKGRAKKHGMSLLSVVHLVV